MASLATAKACDFELALEDFYDDSESEENETASQTQTLSTISASNTDPPATTPSTVVQSAPIASTRDPQVQPKGRRRRSHHKRRHSVRKLPMPKNTNINADASDEGRSFNTMDEQLLGPVADFLRLQTKENKMIKESEMEPVSNSKIFVVLVNGIQKEVASVSKKIEDKPGYSKINDLCEKSVLNKFMSCTKVHNIREKIDINPSNQSEIRNIEEHIQYEIVKMHETDVMNESHPSEMKESSSMMQSDSSKEMDKEKSESSAFNITPSAEKTMYGHGEKYEDEKIVVPSLSMEEHHVYASVPKYPINNPHTESPTAKNQTESVESEK